MHCYTPQQNIQTNLNDAINAAFAVETSKNKNPQTELTQKYGHLFDQNSTCAVLFPRQAKARGRVREQFRFLASFCEWIQDQSRRDEVVKACGLKRMQDGKVTAKEVKVPAQTVVSPLLARTTQL